jgi:DnaJ-class molecular chaperone
MSSDNYYTLLGISEKASSEEIKKAYRALQLKYHPDRNIGNEEALKMTQKINEAYDTLRDENKRQQYDMTQRNPFMSRQHPFFHMNEGGGGNVTELDDILNMMFGVNMGTGMGMGPGEAFHFSSIPGAKFHVFHGGPPPMQKPSSIIKTIHVNMEQVLNGATIPLEVERWILENGNKVFENETIYVKVPQGIDDGEIIILQNKGNAINDIVKGDVKVFVKINNDTCFKRVGLDLVLEKTISLKDALCGFSFELNYINGKSYTLNNNRGNIIPPEYKKVYPGMGLQREDHKGNMIIHFHVEFPTQLSEEAIAKLAEVL